MLRGRPSDRDAALLGRARRGPQPGAAPRHPQRQPGPRGTADGPARRASSGRLNAIENLGSMDVLCTDKTGTLTEGVVQLEGAYDAAGARQRGRAAPRRVQRRARDGAEQPARRRDPARRITPDLARSAQGRRDPVRLRPQADQRHRRARRSASGSSPRVRSPTFSRPARLTCRRDVRSTPPRKAALRARYEAWSRPGHPRARGRTRAPASPRRSYGRDDETRPARSPASSPSSIGRRRASAKAIADLPALGVSVKLITGDSRLVAQHVADARRPARRPRAHRRAISDDLHDEALWHAAERTDLFVEVDPEPEGADHPRPEEDGPRRRLPRRRGQRCARHARRRHQPLGASRRWTWRGRRPTSCSSSATSTSSAAASRKGRTTFANTLEVRADDHEREPRQHGQHGRRFPVPALPAAAGRPDPAQQLPVGRSRRRARRRQRRSRARRAAASAGTCASSAGSWSSSAC